LQYSRPANQAAYKYGTAGFRSDASILDPVMFRVGVAAALRSREQGGQCVGVMITASHNPPNDNGVKICDPSGEMLGPEWEKRVTEMANADDLTQVVKSLIESTPGDKMRVAIGRDTRDSSERLANICKLGLEAIGSEVVDIGVVTTPQLHYHVWCLHKNQPNDYFERLASGFKGMTQGTEGNKLQYVLDCANGVGAISLTQLLKVLGSSITISPVNTDTSNTSKLNVDCGADFVQKAKTWPTSTQSAPSSSAFASLDGDADRVVFFSSGEKGFVLLDGDQITALITLHLHSLLEQAGALHDLSFGVVQTAYANGSSTAFLKQRGVEVACTATGVKHLHKAAHHFDIGLYFEANGHGTCLLSDKFAQVVRDGQSSSEGAKKQAFDALAAFAQVMNPAVGDALSDFLAVAAILQVHNWDLSGWHNNTYSDIPSHMTVVRVQDRSVISTVPDETKATAPQGLQEAIDATVLKEGGAMGRSFVRPSGTEDVVRVYAEAADAAHAAALTGAVMRLVHSLAGGVGPVPTFP